MARGKSRTVTRIYNRPKKSRSPARRAKSKSNVDWNKVAMFGAGALIIFLIFRPKKASAAVLSPGKLREQSASTGIPLSQILDGLTKGFKPFDPSSIVLLPRFSTETVDGVRRCVDNGNLSKPVFADMGFCNTCAGFDVDFKDITNPRNEFCYPRALNEEAYAALEGR